ncbi:hypothetical protein J6590_061986 [Homalodisca vitripennis]|nr:hypothetical protein J6590_061986 [Homalodisca vitripennis]
MKANQTDNERGKTKINCNTTQATFREREAKAPREKMNQKWRSGYAKIKVKRAHKTKHERNEKRD